MTIPRTVNDHPQLREALRKLQIGVPRLAVEADMRRRRLDPELLDVDASSPLPEGLQQKPVVIECTELYLGREAFYDHVGSTDYLDAYEGVMQPYLQNRQCTFRFGDPAPDITEKILQPMLKETAISVTQSCCLWRSPLMDAKNPTLLSLNFEQPEVDRAAVARALTDVLGDQYISCISFPHPCHHGIMRLLCLSLGLLTRSVLEKIGTLQVVSGEVFCDDSSTQSVRRLAQQVDLGRKLPVNESEHVGYWLHDRVFELKPTE